MLFLLAVIGSCRTSNRYIHPTVIPKTKESYAVVAYVAGWTLYPVSKIEAAKLTHINYAFANLDADGRVFFDNWNDNLKIDTLNSLKIINPDLKIIVSVGGWSWSKHFSNVAASQNLRNQCARNIAEFVRRYKLDGIDIDWEYPCMKGAGNSFRPEDKENFTYLLQAIRNSLNSLQVTQKRKEPYILSIAAATSSNYLRSIEPLKVVNYIDFMNIMTYDYRSGDSWETGHHSNLWTSLSDWNNGNCIDKTITRYINAGIPPEKIIMGVPFYGRRWEGVTKKNNGLYQPAVTAGLSITYRNIRRQCTPDAGYVSIWDDSAQAPYLWNQKEGIFISYENQQSLRYKVDYIKQKGLNGIMFWEYTSDYNSELLNAIFYYLETDRYSYKRQRDILLSAPYLVGIHPIILNHFFSFENEYGASDFSTPRLVLGFGNISMLIFAPLMSSLWLSQFFV
jgi:chitinase